MLRQIAAIFLLFAFSAQVFNRAVIVLDYYTNTAFFAKNCENKARPVLHCNGKCQMMKKIKEEENREKNNQQQKTDNKDEVVSSKSFFATVSLQNIIPGRMFAPAINFPIPAGIRTGVFHPPGLVSILRLQLL
jgi:hypothetical protein